jgi:hypothetical protein
MSMVIGGLGTYGRIKEHLGLTGLGMAGPDFYGLIGRNGIHNFTRFRVWDSPYAAMYVINSVHDSKPVNGYGNNNGGHTRPRKPTTVTRLTTRPTGHDDQSGNARHMLYRWPHGYKKHKHINVYVQRSTISFFKMWAKQKDLLNYKAFL